MGCCRHCSELRGNRVGYLVSWQLVPQVTATRPEDIQRLEIAVCLRREFACRLLESSADLHDVRDFLGHANITTTSRYLRSSPVRLAEALERMERSAETIVDTDAQPHLAEVR